MKLTSVVIAAIQVAFAAASGGFSYKPDSDKAPNAWGSLDLGPTVKNECGGSSQSGIDVPTSTCDISGDYIFAPGSCTLDDIDFNINDHVIVATYNIERNGCTPPRMTIPGKAVPYDALQFHIHSGSDHAIDGRYFGADLHLVHKEVGGDSYSVLGFFLEPTDADGIVKVSDLLTEWEKIPTATNAACTPSDTTNNTDATDVGENNTATATQGGRRRTTKSEQARRQLARGFNPYDLVPAGSTMYTYQGSLTTPPCSEVVFWNVIDTPVSISVREYIRAVNLILDWVNPDTCKKETVASESGFTGRPVQPINGREINRICPTGFTDSSTPSATESSQSSNTNSTGNASGNKSGASTGSATAGLAVFVAALMTSMI